jgi:hypothetical protein
MKTHKQKQKQRDRNRRRIAKASNGWWFREPAFTTKGRT